MDAREHKRQTQERFGATADLYVESRTHSAGSDLDRVRALADAAPGQRALDIATGGGHTARTVALEGAWTVATDLTVPMLRSAGTQLASHDLTVPLCAADAEALPFASASFDLVTCRIAPHHFDAPATFVAEVGRVLKPGGVFVLEDHRAKDEPRFAAWLDDVERQRDPSHVQAYTETQWRAWCEASGLAVEYTETYHKEHDFADWCSRQAMSSTEVAELEHAFLHAPEGVSSAFAFVMDGEKLVQWTDDKLLLRAVRRGPAA